MLIFKDKINYKLPGGGGFAPHQDAPAYNHISKVEHVTANIAIHEATSKNGCLEVIPGSHKMQIDLVPGGGQITQEWCDTHTWLPVPLGVGDVLIFGSHLAHRSGPNRSTSPRAMLYATYAGARDGRDLREKYYAHRREAFPPDHGETRARRRSFRADSNFQNASRGRTTRKAGRRMHLRLRSPNKASKLRVVDL